jgi:hypothetical protein
MDRHRGSDPADGPYPVDQLTHVRGTWEGHVPAPQGGDTDHWAGATALAPRILDLGEQLQRGHAEVRQERQKACLQVMDMYAVFNSESVRRREEMEAGTVLDEASLQSYADHSINLIPRAATCAPGT